MNLYYIKSDYIDYLKVYDSSVRDNKNMTRPYVGIIFSIEDYNYFAPLASPKPKHKKMKNNIDCRKIDGGRLGVVNLNNMIPVPKSSIVLIDIKNIADKNYRKLLFKQAEYLNHDEDIIHFTAKKLYKLSQMQKSELKGYQKKILDRCCNFKKLEAALDIYLNKKPKIYKGKSPKF